MYVFVCILKRKTKLGMQHCNVAAHALPATKHKTHTYFVHSGFIGLYKLVLLFLKRQLVNFGISVKMSSKQLIGLEGVEQRISSLFSVKKLDDFLIPDLDSGSWPQALSVS